MRRTYPNTDLEGPKWDFGPISVISVIIVSGRGLCETECVLKVKLLSVPKKDL